MYQGATTAGSVHTDSVCIALYSMQRETSYTARKGPDSACKSSSFLLLLLPPLADSAC